MKLTQRARQVLPGGVNSPVRAFGSVGVDPVVPARGEGACLYTTEDRALIDFCLSFGPLILGHAHPAVVEAVQAAVARGTSYGLTAEPEVELAETICGAVPGLDRLRLVNSGTEACMTAVRLARGATGRSKVLKCTGCYHGHLDGLLVQAGSGVAGIATASSAGVPESVAADTLLVPYNDTDALDEVIAEHGPDIAVIAVEPVAGNMGVIPPGEGFLQHLRRQADATGALLLFDEVITGFRFTFGSYQDIAGVRPDLYCFGKIIGGGMPIGAVGGRAGLMDRLAPLGDVYQAGTLSGNPVSVAAGLATLTILNESPPYEQITRRAAACAGHIRALAEERGVPLQVPQTGPMFSLYFSDTPVRNFAEVQATEADRFRALYPALLEEGVFFPPSPFEACFLSAAHDDETMDRAADKLTRAFQKVF